MCESKGQLLFFLHNDLKYLKPMDATGTHYTILFAVKLAENLQKIVANRGNGDKKGFSSALAGLQEC